MRADTPSAWHRTVTNTNCRTSVSFNQYHSGLGYGLSENSKQDGGWGTSLIAGAFGPQPHGSSTVMTCLFTPCRLVFKGMSVSRPNAMVGKCRMIRHSRDKKNEPNPQRYVLCSFTFLLSPFKWGRLQD